MHPGQLDVPLLALSLFCSGQQLAIPLNTFTLSGSEQTRRLFNMEISFRILGEI